MDQYIWTACSMAIVAIAWFSGVPAMAQVSATAELRVNVFVDDRRNKIAMQRISIQSIFPAYVYRQQASTDGTMILPSSQPLMNWWKGSALITPKNSALYQSETQFAPVLLVVEITNETVAPLQIVNAYLRVDQSQTDRQPLIGIQDSEVASAQVMRTIVFWNDGWGVAEQSNIVFAFGHNGTKTASFRASLGSLGSVEFVPERALAEIAPAVRALQQKPPKCTRERVAACLAGLEKRGLLGKLAGKLKVSQGSDSVTTNIFGLLSYRWKDASGNIQSREQQFRQEIGIFDFDTGVAPEYGAPAPGESGFNPIKLPSDAKSHRQPLPYRGNIGPGAVRRFELTLEADRASQHTFYVVFETSDGRGAMSQRINLNYFKPNIDRGGMREVR